MPGTAVPFRWIRDLPDTAQKDIERNFLALQQQINTSASVFDATIDPTLSASVPTNHVYKHLTDLLASETWAATHLFVIGVRAALLTAIKEPVATTLAPPGPFTMIAMGATGGEWETLAGANARQEWDINGCTITVPTSTVCTLRNILLRNSGAAVTPFHGVLHLENCRVQGSDGGGTNIVITSPATSIVTAFNTMFESTVFNSSAYCWDCHLYWAVSSSPTINPNGSVLIWDGGTMAAAPSDSPGT